MFFFVIIKNLNWEILTKNLVTFKRWYGVKDKNFDILGASWKTQFLREIHEKLIYKGGMPKERGLNSL